MEFDLEVTSVLQPEYELQSPLPAVPSILVKLEVGQGVAGAPGAAASLSAAADNRAEANAGIFVPELRSDPLAFYILAKA